SFSLTSAGEDILAQTYVLKDTINQIQGIAELVSTADILECSLF
ncbi:hypothetical protein V12B01_00060, partial [Vibrio splendidus 12B01]